MSMLRRPVKRGQTKSNEEEGKKVRKKASKQQPLGSVKDKDQTEHDLESLVLGGDEELIQKLNETDKVLPNIFQQNCRNKFKHQ